jgi:hypothetical protein
MLKALIVLMPCNWSETVRRFMVLLPLLFCTCADKFDPAAYWPLFEGYHWRYDGMPGSITIQEDRTAAESGFFALYGDSAGYVFWREHYISRDHNLYWDFFTPSSPMLPIVRFEPAIPILPFSDQVGSQRHLESVEKAEGRPDQPFLVRCQIEEVTSVTVPAGTFNNTIHMSMRLRYLGEGTGLMIKEQAFWFAKGVGPVRMEWNGKVSELQSATLGTWQTR